MNATTAKSKSGKKKSSKAAAAERLSRKEYDKELERLHVELVKLQQWVVQEGLKVCIVFEGRDGAGADAEEDHPPVQEGEQRAEGVPDVEVESPRVRLHRAQLTVGQRAQQREHAAEEPRQHRQADGAAGLREDAAGD